MNENHLDLLISERWKNKRRIGLIMQLYLRLVGMPGYFYFFFFASTPFSYVKIKHIRSKLKKSDTKALLRMFIINNFNL